MPQAVGALVPIFFSGGSLTFFGSVAANVGLAAASFALKSVLSPRRQSDGGKFEIKNTVNATSQPEFRVYGRDLVGGQLFFYAAKNDTLYLGVVTGSGTIDRFELVRLYSEEVLLDAAGFVTSPPYTENGDRLVQFEFRQGYEDDAVSTILRDNFEEWTDDHTLPGLPYYVGAFKQSEAESFQKIYHGEQPDPQVIIRGAKCYDRRQAGHSATDADTWEWSDNPGVIARDFIVSLRGRGIGADLVDQDDIDAFADYCDVIRPTTLRGPQKAFRMGGEYEVNEKPQEVFSAILGTGGAVDYLKPNGKIGLHFGPITETPFEITTDMIDERSIAQSSPLYETYTSLDVFYTSPEHGFNKQPAGRVDRTDLVARRGKTVTEEFYNDMVQDADQALRLAYLRLWEDQPDFSGTLTLNHKAVGVLFDDNMNRRRLVRVPNRILDIYETFEILSIDMAADFSRIVLQVRTYHAEKWDFNPIDEGFTQPEVPDELSDDEDLPEDPGNLSGVAIVIDNDPAPDDITIAFTWDLSTLNTETQIAQWREVGEPDWNDVANVVPGTNVVILDNPTDVLDQDSLEFRVNRYSADGYQSGFETHSFTVSDTAMGTAAPASLLATGGIEVVSLTITQADEPTAIAVEYLVNSSPTVSDWSGASRELLSRNSVLRETTPAGLGITHAHARAEYLDGTYSAAITQTFTVTEAQTSNQGSSGDNGNNSGSSGTNDTNTGSQDVDFGGIY